MSEKTSEAKPMSAEFLRLISGEEEPPESNKIPKNMDFPLLEDMEMDVPLFGDYASAEHEFLEDDSETDMQCLLHINPCLGMSSLSV